MPTLGTSVLTLADWAKRLDPDGKIPMIVELLEQTNEILIDMLWLEGNLPTGHRVTVRTGLPTVAWRLLNQGITPSKSTTAQIDEAVGLLEAWSSVDVELAKLNGNTAEFRLSEARAFIEAMNQEMAATLFYGNSGLAPEEFTGLSVRYSSLSAANAQNIIDAGGTSSNNSSIWLVGWGEQSIFGIFPKGSKAGLEHNDLGEETVEVAGGIAGALMRAYRDQWKWKSGIALKDWRYVVRIVNIDVAGLVAETAAANITKLLIKAIHRIPNLGVGKNVIYANRTIMEFLDIQRYDNGIAGGVFSLREIDSKWIPFFRNIPMRTCDALLETEDRVV